MLNLSLESPQTFKRSSLRMKSLEKKKSSSTPYARCTRFTTAAQISYLRTIVLISTMKIAARLTSLRSIMWNVDKLRTMIDQIEQSDRTQFLMKWLTTGSSYSENIPINLMKNRFISSNLLFKTLDIGGRLKTQQEMKNQPIKMNKQR